MVARTPTPDQTQGYPCSVLCFAVLMPCVAISLPCVLEDCQPVEEEHLFCGEVIATQWPLIARIFHWEQPRLPFHLRRQPDYKSSY